MSKVGWGIDDVKCRACCYARDIERTRGDGAEERPRSRGDPCFASAVDDEHGPTLVLIPYCRAPTYLLHSTQRRPVCPLHEVCLLCSAFHRD